MTSLFDRPLLYELGQRNFLTSGLRKLTRELLARESTGRGGCRALDVGCGTGQYADAAGTEAFAADVSMACLRFVRRKGRARRVFCADAARLPVREGSLDFLYCVNALHHMPDGTATAVLHQMWRACAPGGRVVVVDVVFPPSRAGNVVGWLLRRFDRGRFMRERGGLKALLAAFGDGVGSPPRFIDVAAFPHDATAAVYEKRGAARRGGAGPQRYNAADGG